MLFGLIVVQLVLRKLLLPPLAPVAAEELQSLSSQTPWAREVLLVWLRSGSLMVQPIRQVFAHRDQFFGGYHHRYA